MTKLTIMEDTYLASLEECQKKVVNMFNLKFKNLSINLKFRALIT